MESIKKIRRLNLQRIVTELGSQKALAEKLERSPNQIWQIVSAPEDSPHFRGLNEDLAREFEKKLNMAEGSLDKYYNLKPLPPFTEEHYRFIPMINLESSTASAKLILHPIEEDKMLFDNTEFEKYNLDIKNVFGMPVVGNDMFPTLSTQDKVIVNANKNDVEDGRVYALFLDQVLQLRRIFKGSNNSLRIATDNTHKNLFPDKEISAEELTKRVNILGRVIAVSKFGEI